MCGIILKIKILNTNWTQIRSFVGYLGFVAVFYLALHFTFVYPTAYLVHKAIEQPSIEYYLIMKKTFTHYMAPCSYEVYLKNENQSKISCVPYGSYKKININDVVLVESYQSFLGYTVEKITIIPNIAIENAN